MPKGIFTQSSVVLFKEEIDLSSLKDLLSEFTIFKEIAESEDWAMSGPSLVLEFDKELNGKVVVDIVNRPWPDGMGDPKEEFNVFGAWTMGHFGPHAFPNGLYRSIEQTRNWNPENVSDHKSFVRVKLSYVLGDNMGDKPIMPDGSDVLEELLFVTDVSLALLEHDKAICYFNPNGETLFKKNDIKESLEYAGGNEVPPIDIWSNIRLYSLTDDWIIMDTVGAEQFDITDLEVCFPKDNFNPNEVANFMRSFSIYVFENYVKINDNDTTDGPGNINWVAKNYEEGLTRPPRNVVRLLPENVENLPDELKEAK